MPPELRSWAKGNLLLGPSFPSTRTGQGTFNPAVHGYNPIALMGHPGTFQLLACAASARGLACRRSVAACVLVADLAGSPPAGLEVFPLGRPAGLGGRRPGRQWHGPHGRARRCRGDRSRLPRHGAGCGRSGFFHHRVHDELQRPVLGLAARRSAADRRSPGRPAGGAVGGRQYRQLAGPVVIVLGLSAVGAARSAGGVLRMTLLPAAVLMASAVLTTWTLVALHH